MLVPLCRVLRPTSALPCRDILQRKRPLLISNPPPLYAHVPCCFAICLARPPRRAFFVLSYSLLPLIVSGCFSLQISVRFAKSANAEFRYSVNRIIL